MEGNISVCTNVLTDREYLGITIPFMLSTMTQLLMGAVNTAVMGQLPDPKYIAAVALGAILFNNIYWFSACQYLWICRSSFGFWFQRRRITGFFKTVVHCCDSKLQLHNFAETYFDSLSVIGCSGFGCSRTLFGLL